MRKFFAQMARLKGTAAFLIAAALVFALAACANTTNTEDPEQHTITFNSQEGSPVDPITENEGTEVAKPADPTRSGGYTFKGWYNAASGGTLYTWPHTLNADVTMYAQWEPPVETPPVLTGTVTVTGTPQSGQVLTAVTTSLGGSGAISYAWQRGDSATGSFAAISGATAATYTPAAADLDKYVRVTVSRADNSGTVSSAATGPVSPSSLPPLSGTVTVTGTPQVGQILTAVTTSLGGSGAISYAWQRGDSATGSFAAIADASAATYTPAAADLDKYLRVTVSRSDNSETVSSDATGPISPSPLPDLTGTVTATGTPQSGQILTAVTTELGGSGTISYAWERGDSATGSFAAISGATAATYTLAATDLDKYVRVTASREGYNGTVSSAPAGPVVLPPLTGAVTATGTAAVNGVLTAVTTALDGSGTISYAWERGDSADGAFAAIAGATASTYTSVTGDLNKYIRVVVSREGHSGTVSSAATGPVSLPLLTGAVTVTGTAQVGQVLTAVTTNLGGSGTISYAWERGDSATGSFAAISGATAATYTLTAEDLNKYVRATVSRVDNSGTVSSAAAGPISLPPLTGTVTVTGTAQVGMTLTANTAGLGGGGTISYQWQRGDSADGTFTVISGATDASYSLTTADLNKHVRVRVSRVNNTGTVDSDATAAVGLQLPMITIGFNYGAISVSGNNGRNIIYKNNEGSITLRAAGYTDVKWYIDGDGSPGGTGDSITLNASDYSASTHSVTFTGKRDDKLYSQAIPFTVGN
jgi:uncharacterized repeat protein (TIGR02543 family)